MKAEKDYYIPERTLLPFYPLQEHLSRTDHLSASPSVIKCEFIFIISCVVQIKLSRFVIFVGVNSYSVHKAIYHCQSHNSLEAPSPKRNFCFDRRCRGRQWDGHCRGSSGLQGLCPKALSHSGVKALSEHTKANIAQDSQRHSVCRSPRAFPPVTKIEAASHRDTASQLA